MQASCQNKFSSNVLAILEFHFKYLDCRGCMVVECTTTTCIYAIWQCLSSPTLWVWSCSGEVYKIQHYVCQWLAACQWSSLVSSSNKIVCHDIAEILLKVALNTITLTPLLYQWYWYIPTTIDTCGKSFHLSTSARTAPENADTTNLWARIVVPLFVMKDTSHRDWSWYNWQK